MGGFVRVKRKVLVVLNGVIRKYKCDLTVDPYTQAANGKVRLVINAYFDGAKRRNGAIIGKILK